MKRIGNKVRAERLIDDLIVGHKTFGYCRFDRTCPYCRKMEKLRRLVKAGR